MALSLENYKEDPFQHIVRVEISLAGRPFVKVAFDPSGNSITFGGVGLSRAPNGRDAWGIAPLGGSVSVNVPMPAEVPFEAHTARIGLFMYEDTTPGALEDAIASAAGGLIEDIPGPAYGSGVLFTNQAGYTGTLESLVLYSGLVYSLDEFGGLVAEVTFPDGLHAIIVTHDPPLYPVL